MKKTAQMNIDYAIGFATFIVVFTVFLMMFNDNMNTYFSELNSVKKSVRGFDVENRVFMFLKGEGLEVNKTALQIVEECYTSQDVSTRMDRYNRIKKEIMLNSDENIYLVLDYFVVGYALDENSDGDHTGYAELNGATHTLNISKEGKIYNLVEVDGSGPFREGNTLNMDGRLYFVERIDPSGNFVLFKSTLAKCGSKPAVEEKFVENYFFLKLDGHILRVGVMYK